MTKIDKIVKIDNSTNANPLTFVNRLGINFTVPSNDTLEFKVKRSLDALYYTKSIGSEYCSTQDHFDSDSGLVAFKAGDKLSTIKFADLTTDAIESLLNLEGEGEVNKTLITVDYTGGTMPLLFAQKTVDNNIVIFFGDSSFIWSKTAWSDATHEYPAGYNNSFSEQIEGFSWDKQTLTATIIPPSGVTATIASFDENCNGVLFGNGGEAPTPPTPKLTEFAAGQTISGIVIDPNAVPDGYASMDAFLANLQYNQDDAHIFFGLSNGSSTDGASAVTMGGAYLLRVGAGDTSAIYASSAIEGLVPSTGWYRTNDMVVESPITEKTIVPAWYNDVSASAIVWGSPTSATDPFDSDFAALNGVVLGAVEGKPTPTLTPFYARQTISGIDFGSVQNGDTNTAMDTFLNFQGQGESDMLIVGTLDGGWLSRYHDDTYGLLFYQNETSQELIVFYATAAGSMEGTSFSEGYQNLTDGKYLFATSTTVSQVNPNITGWNGSLIGAVENTNE